MAQNVTLMGATYQDVPKIILPKAGGGDAEFVDVTDTTAAAADVKSGKAFHLADGSLATGSLLWDFKGDDCELVQQFYDQEIALEDTNFATWTPSTTATVIRSGVAGTVVALPMSAYDYLVHWRVLFTAAYKSDATLKAQIFKEGAELWQAIFRRPSNLANIEAQNFNQNTCISLQTALLNIYYNTSGTKTSTYSISYGIYPTVVAATFSSTTAASPNVTLYPPNIYACCNASYFATARAAELDQANSKIHIVGELYRSRPGAVMRSIYGGLIDLFNASSK